MNTQWRKQLSTDRTNDSALGQWWWTVDRWLLVMFTSLLIVSAVIVTAASPPVAKRVGLDSYHFVMKHYSFLAIAPIIMIGLSMCGVQRIRRLCTLGMLGTLAVLLVLPVIGSDAKGAARWLNLGVITVQPSEFLKPFFAVTIAWLLAERHYVVGFPAYRVTMILFALSALLLLIQPDVGMTMTLAAMYGVQLFLSGIALLWIIIMGAFAACLLWSAYLIFPHVAQRINGFLDPSSTDNYQVQKSLEAFSAGGLTGTGPGEGSVKWSLPDAHTDFIFAVVGEEFGLIGVMLIVGVFMLIVLRGLYRAHQANDSFTLIATAGLVTQLGLQAFINMGVAVHLLPAKGMTLPFLSYGGSSLCAIAVTAGCMLGLSRRRFGALHHMTYFNQQRST